MSAESTLDTPTLHRSPRIARRLVVRRLTVVGGVAAALLLTWLVIHVGWLDRDRTWQSSTGWDRIPSEQRAPVVDSIATADGPLGVLWLGHSGFLLDWGGTRIVLDPNTNDRCTIAPRVIADVPDVEALAPADAVLVSHAHYDHFDLATMRRMKRPGLIVVPSGSARWLEELEPLAREMEPWQERVVGSLHVTAVPAAHNGNRFHPLASRNIALGYVIRRGTTSVYYSGDTGARNDFEEIGERLHPEIAILPIGAYRPSFPMKRYHLSPADAVDVARRVDAQLVVPAHFGTFVLALDSTDEALPEFARVAAGRGVSWVMPSMSPARNRS